MVAGGGGSLWHGMGATLRVEGVQGEYKSKAHTV